MLTKYIFLAFLGACGGGLIATGYFALITALGIINNFAQKTHTSRHIVRYEDCVIFGGILGNVIWIFNINLNTSNTMINYVIVAVCGLFYGIFVGSLVIALSENLKVLPIFFRRFHITKGLAVIVVTFAIGKAIGNIVYFVFNLARGG